MHPNEINSVGWLHNHNKTICLTICLRHVIKPVFVTISRDEFNAVGGIEEIKKNKQLAIDFFNKYGAGRP